jgi:polyhydroxyalkanoate synthesis regulator protein
LTPGQKKGFTDHQEAFKGHRRETVGLIGKLKSVKEQLKGQEEMFERVMTHFREEMNPLQSARLILFGERNKLRKQFSLFCDEFAH